jgi:hypothetical protein
MSTMTFRRALTEAGVFTARPAAFLIVGAYAVGWVLFEWETFDWHGVATLATWTMTLFIQRAEHRDTQPSTLSSTNCSRRMATPGASWATSIGRSRRRSRSSETGRARTVEEIGIIYTACSPRRRQAAADSLAARPLSALEK